MSRLLEKSEATRHRANWFPAHGQQLPRTEAQSIERENWTKSRLSPLVKVSGSPTVRKHLADPLKAHPAQLSPLGVPSAWNALSIVCCDTETDHVQCNPIGLHLAAISRKLISSVLLSVHARKGNSLKQSYFSRRQNICIRLIYKILSCQ